MDHAKENRHIPRQIDDVLELIMNQLQFDDVLNLSLVSHQLNSVVFNNMRFLKSMKLVITDFDEHEKTQISRNYTEVKFVLYSNYIRLTYLENLLDFGTRLTSLEFDDILIRRRDLRLFLEVLGNLPKLATLSLSHVYPEREIMIENQRLKVVIEKLNHLYVINDSEWLLHFIVCHKVSTLVLQHSGYIANIKRRDCIVDFLNHTEDIESISINGDGEYLLSSTECFIPTFKWKFFSLQLNGAINWFNYDMLLTLMKLSSQEGKFQLESKLFEPSTILVINAISFCPMITTFTFGCDDFWGNYDVFHEQQLQIGNIRQLELSLFTTKLGHEPVLLENFLNKFINVRCLHLELDFPENFEVENVDNLIQSIEILQIGLISHVQHVVFPNMHTLVFDMRNLPEEVELFCRHQPSLQSVTYNNNEDADN